LKKQTLENYLKQIKQEARKEGKVQNDNTFPGNSVDWVSDQSTELACELSEFVTCAEEHRFYYRNKTELTFGTSGVDGGLTVGFNVTETSGVKRISIEFP
jgi:tRNA/tmRNA/rRNA uracil-C5-methylase (TrmA/RlmC/RlmD family)